MPLYEHDCPLSQFIKTEDNKDYYYCKTGSSFGGWTIIIRNSSEEGDYESYNASWFTYQNINREDPKFRELSLVLMHFLAGTQPEVMTLVDKYQ